MRLLKTIVISVLLASTFGCTTQRPQNTLMATENATLRQLSDYYIARNERPYAIAALRAMSVRNNNEEEQLRRLVNLDRQQAQFKRDGAWLNARLLGSER